jgi:RHS repeat-associated protein
VTITGAGFGATQSTSTVNFWGAATAAAVTSWSDTQIVATVPAGTSTGPVSVTVAGSTSTGTLTNPFRYTARELDPETNLFFYRARYYDPVIGRFTIEDPLRFGGGDTDFYGYVRENPMNHTDPSGTTPLHGNWCGPDWTGGLKEEYNPPHAGLYKNPVDPEDEVCKHHDICYFKCRSTFPCDRGERSNCMKTCDQIFVGEMPHTATGDTLASGIYWHQFHPDPGTNEHCGCKTKGK